MRAGFVFFLVMLMPNLAVSADCNSVNASVGNRAVTIARRAMLANGAIELTGKFDGKASPRRVLPCVALAEGVLCAKQFAYGKVTIMTKGNLMIETVTDLGGKEVSFSYACNQSFKISQRDVNAIFGSPMNRGSA